MTTEAKQLLNDNPELCREIAVEYAEWYINHIVDDSFETFLKEHTAKDWEILSFKGVHLPVMKSLGDNGTYNGHTLENMLNDDKGSVRSGDWIIHSVRRLSDNEVFTVGDETKEVTIEKFEISDRCFSGMYAIMDNGKWSIDYLTKRTPLFITEDGVNIFEGDEITPVAIRNFKIYPSDRSWKGNSPEKFKYFSTREAAEQWVEDNKPSISKAQLLNAGFSTQAINDILKK